MDTGRKTGPTGSLGVTSFDEPGTECAGRPSTGYMATVHGETALRKASETMGGSSTKACAYVCVCVCVTRVCKEAEGSWKLIREEHVSNMLLQNTLSWANCLGLESLVNILLCSSETLNPKPQTLNPKALTLTGEP